MLIAVRTQVDTQIHPVQAYVRSIVRFCVEFFVEFVWLCFLIYLGFRNIQKGKFMEVGKSEISPSFDSMLALLYEKGEHLAFVPDTNETRLMLDVLSLRFPLIKVLSLTVASSNIGHMGALKVFFSW